MTLLVKILIGNLLLCGLVALLIYAMQKDDGDSSKSYSMLYKYTLISSTGIIIGIMMQFLVD